MVGFGRARHAVRAMQLAVVCGAIAIGTGCGRCEGAIRDLTVDAWEDRVTFVVVGDGPGGVTSEELRDLSGVDASTFTIEGPDGPVEAPVFGSWGGHSCLNGVTFAATVEGATPGTYEAVLRVDRLAWPYLGAEDWLEERDGERVFVATGELEAAPAASEGE